MRIDELVWDEWNVEHIASHGVEPEEVEEVYDPYHWVERAGITRSRCKTVFQCSQPPSPGASRARISCKKRPLVAWDAPETGALSVLYRELTRYGLMRYRLYGQTESGRYLFVVIDREYDDAFYVVTAREMIGAEKRRFRRLRKR